MTEVLKIGSTGYQVNDAEAAWLMGRLGSAGGLIPEVDPTKTIDQQNGAPLIYFKLIKVMQAINAVGKDGVNTTQNYPFRGIDGVVNEVGPAMRKIGVFCLPVANTLKYRDAMTTANKATREVTGNVTYRFFAEDGSSLDAIVPAESLDQSDKGTAKAMSVALRILLLQTFMIPTQEPTTDHDGHYHQRGGQPIMSEFERTTGLALLASPTDEQRAAGGPVLMRQAFQQAIDFGVCLDEHAAWLAPTNGEESPTWEELLSERVKAEVHAADTGLQVNDIWEMLKAAKLLNADRLEWLKFRGLAIKERNAKALSTIVEQITTATNLDDLLGPVRDSINSARHLGRITLQEEAELLALGEERHGKLKREADVPAVTSAYDEDGHKPTSPELRTDAPVGDDPWSSK